MRILLDDAVRESTRRGAGRRADANVKPVARAGEAVVNMISYVALVARLQSIEFRQGWRS